MKDHSKSELLLDGFICQKKPVFVQKMREMGTHVEIIPGTYTYVLQPCDVGVMRPFKNGIRKEYSKWASYMYSNLGPVYKLLVPERSDVLKWIDHSWSTVSSQSIRDTYRYIGLIHNDYEFVEESSGDDGMSQASAVGDSDDDMNRIEYE